MTKAFDLSRMRIVGCWIVSYSNFSTRNRKMTFLLLRIVEEGKFCASRNKCCMGKKSHLARGKTEENKVGSHCKGCNYPEWRRVKVVEPEEMEKIKFDGLGRLVEEERFCTFRNKCQMGLRSHLVRGKNEENIMGQHCQDCSCPEWRRIRIIESAK